jgi:two-component system, NtrC family, response regulator AtoC
VLVVEDNDDSREALLELCRLTGHDCVSASSRAEALGLIISRPPDAILLDLMLPDGNGMEVLRIVRAHSFPARVAVVTAADSPMVAEVRKLRPDALFRKPVDFGKVRRWLDAT